MSCEYDVELDGTLGTWMHVEFTTEVREVTDYAVVLLVEEGGQLETVRVYDSAHGENEMHRYTREGGKQAAEVFHRDTLGAGMRAAIESVKRGYLPMIESWHRR
jgi:hypothetical protein